MPRQSRQRRTEQMAMEIMRAEEEAGGWRSRSSAKLRNAGKAVTSTPSHRMAVSLMRSRSRVGASLSSMTVAHRPARWSCSASSYSGLDGEFAHETVDHAGRYVDGQVHTNGAENFWSLLKRGLHGTYVSVEPFHLFRDLDERVFAYNLRELDDYGRFATVLRMAAGRRLTYAELTGQR